MRLFVDRITEGIAVCETPTQTFVKLPLHLLPEDVCEGSVLLEENGVYTLDPAEETRRRKALFDLQESLFDQDDDA